MNKSKVPNSADWNRLCALTTELVPQFGSRPAAFKEACRRLSECCSVPPGGSVVVEERNTETRSAGTQPRLNGAAYPGEIAGKAKPWNTIFGDLGIATRSGATELPDAAGGKAKPWSEVFQQIERDSRG
jgi:hypothetical protein